MKNILAVLAIFVAALFVVSCSSTLTVKEVKNDQYVGQTVKVAGKVDNSIKLGSISGYTLRDENQDRISVKSETLPKEGDEVVAQGTLMKDTLLGYYILEK
jgi:hypothetical protein